MDWNFADSTKVFQDSAGTVPGAVNFPIGRIVDSSPNGNNGLQASSSARPIWDPDLSVYWDGTDDSLRAVFTLSQPVTIFAVVQQVSYTSGDCLWDGANVYTGLLQQLGASPSVSMYSGSYAAANTGLTIGNYFVVTEVFDGASSNLQVNNATATTGNPGTGSMGGFCLGTRGDQGSQFSNISCKRVIVRAGTVSAPTTAAVKAGLAAQFGITL